ncbi:DUF86 domain-containing protein [Candidatus Woesebacteria bacterium]|nr:DUF86 domain-containing protein [Candidatus Woesebacteria bacterium]
MNPVDTQIVTRKSKFVLEDLKRLEEYAKLSLEEYLDSFEAQMLTQRLLERILTRVIDINYHILSHKYQVIPTDYTDSFVQMMRSGEISSEMMEQMKPSAGLRNALSHEYDEIDSEKVYVGMKKTLEYVRGYLRYILDKNPVI